MKYKKSTKSYNRQPCLDAEIEAPLWQWLIVIAIIILVFFGVKEL